MAVRGIGAGCDEEAVRVIKESANWNPPMQRDKPVIQRIVLPIKFQLQTPEEKKGKKKGK